MPAIRKNEKPVKKVLSEEKITDEDETSSSAGSDSSEDETTSDDKSTSTPAKTSGEESEEDEDEDMIADEAESGESDREESDEESSSQKKTSKSTSKKSKPAPKQTIVGNIPPKPFRAPKGFAPLKKSKSTPETIPALSNLEGKQIWHITAPANLKISTLSQFTLKAIEKGETVLSRKETDYALVEEGSGLSSKKVLLLADQSVQKYKKAPVAVTKTLHFEQIPQIDNGALITEEVVAPGNAEEMKKYLEPTPRVQPTGLKMRYTPFGRSGEDTSAFRAPPVAAKEETESTDKKKKKRKHEAESVADAPKKSKKKHGDATVSSSQADMMEVDEAPTKEKKEKKEKKKSKKAEK